MHAVVLTAKQFDAATLHSLVTGGGTAARLGHELVDAVRARQMDGVNLDLEGLGDTDRAAFAAFAIAVANAVHSADPHWQVTLCTYTNSAGDSTGYFDVARLAPAFDGLFVMAYDMQGDNPSAVAPLRGAQTNDSESVASYSRVVGPSKVILGMPFYGVDWPTASGDHAADRDRHAVAGDLRPGRRRRPPALLGPGRRRRPGPPTRTPPGSGTSPTTRTRSRSR